MDLPGFWARPFTTRRAYLSKSCAKAGTWCNLLGRAVYCASEKHRPFHNREGIHVNSAARLRFFLGTGLIFAAAFGTSAAHALEHDLRKAVLVTPRQLSKSEARAVQMLADEVHKRTMVRWEVSRAWPAASVPVIAVGPEASLQSFAGPYAGAPARGSRLNGQTAERNA